MWRDKQTFRLPLQGLALMTDAFVCVWSWFPASSPAFVSDCVHKDLVATRITRRVRKGTCCHRVALCAVFPSNFPTCTTFFYYLRLRSKNPRPRFPDLGLVRICITSHVLSRVRSLKAKSTVATTVINSRPSLGSQLRWSAGPTSRPNWTINNLLFYLLGTNNSYHPPIYRYTNANYITLLAF